MQFKVGKKDIFWSYFGQILFSGINVILLPFVLKLLSSQELGLWYTYTALGTLIMLLDFGLGTTLTRYIAYSMNGASSIDDQGTPIFNIEKGPNIELYKLVIMASKKIYKNIAIISLLIVVIVGLPYMLFISSGEIETRNVVLSWLFFSAAIILNLMYAYCTPILKGINEIKSYYQIMVLSKTLQLIISITLLLVGMNLLGISVAYLVSSISTRILSMIFYKRSVIYDQVKEEFSSINISLSQVGLTIKKIKSSIVKQGTISISYFVNERSSLLIVSAFYGLSMSAKFGLTVQIFSLISVFANVYYNAMIAPIISQKSNGRHKEAFSTIKKTLGIQFLIFTTSSILVITFGNMILLLIRSNSLLLGTNMLIIYSIYILLFNYQTICSNYIVMDNRFPMLKAYVITGLFLILIELLLSIFYINFGLYNILVTQLLLLILYNGWKWPSKIASENEQSTIRMIADSISLGFHEIVSLLKFGGAHERS